MANTTGKKFGGRVKGTPNKSTELAREAIAKFVDDNSLKLQKWLDAIAKDDPYKAFNCVKDLMEYHLPKLARVEQQTLDKDGEAIDPAQCMLTWVADRDNNDLPNKKVTDG